MPSKPWFPTALQDFGRRKKTYCMSARHRGDMYHIKAALVNMPIDERFPILLYDSEYPGSDLKPWTTKGLEDYLSWALIDNQVTQYEILIVSWSRDELFAANKPDEEKLAKAHFRYKGQRMETLSPDSIKQVNGFKMITEWQATVRITTPLIGLNEENGDRSVRLRAIASGMAVFKNSESQGHMDRIFAKIAAPEYKNRSRPLFPPTTENRKNILVLYRATGESDAGVYPEMDSGEAIHDIAEVIKGIKLSGERTLNAVIAGDKENLGIDSIGEYFLLLKQNAELQSLGESARDVETYFMKWAYDLGHYSMVVGFRSGAVDLFTFLGIPTVSIGLRYLVSEDRHAFLAQEYFRRYNVQYDHPRHKYTAWVQNMEYGVASTDPVILQSPFIAGKCPERITPRDDTFTRGVQPGRFHPWDKYIFEVGLRIAVAKEIKWDETIVSLGKEPNRVIDSSFVRYCYRRHLSSSEFSVFFQVQKELESQQIAQRDSDKQLSKELQEDGNIRYEHYIKEYTDDWKKVLSLLEAFL